MVLCDHNWSDRNLGCSWTKIGVASQHHLALNFLVQSRYRHCNVTWRSNICCAPVFGACEMTEREKLVSPFASKIALVCSLVVSPHTVAADSLPSATNSDGGGAYLTSITLANTGSSAVVADSVTPLFGHPFRKGDIPNGCSGSAPRFTLSDGTTNVPFSESLRPTCWNDGSLKFASFMLRLPKSHASEIIPAGGSIDIKIFSGGRTPPPSTRSLSDFSAGGTDLKISVSGADNTLVGTWISDLAQGISDAIANPRSHSDNYQFMDGAAGAVWRIRASFRQSNADHGQLEGYWYVQALNDGANNLAGLRYMVRVAQPWYDVNLPSKNYRALATLASYDGPNLLHDYLAGHFTTQTFTAAARTREFVAAAHGMQSGWLAYISCSEACPGGMSPNTPYFVNAGTGSPNTFLLATGEGASVTGNSWITPTDAGRGTLLITTHPFVAIFSSIFTADSNGKMEYVQGGGSVASDSTIQVKFDNVYWRSTRMLPPFDLKSGINPKSGDPQTYFPTTVSNTAGFIRNIGETGQSLEMGLIPLWSARHFYNQSLTDEHAGRINALSSALQPVMVRNHTYGTVPCGISVGVKYNSLPPCDMGLAVSQDTGHTHGFTYVDSVAPNSGFSGMDYSHWGPNVWYAYLQSGEPEYLDEIIDFAQMGVIGRPWCSGTETAVVSATMNWIGGKRCAKIAGTYFSGFTFYAGNLLRTDAWSMRDVQNAAAIIPENSYEGGVGESRYLKDMAHQSFLAANAYVGMLDPGTQALGMWNEVSNPQAVNVQAFFLAAVGYAGQIVEDSAAITFYNYLAKWGKAVHDHNSGWTLSYYSALGRQSKYNNASSGYVFDPYFYTFDNFAICTPAPVVTWTSGSYPTGGQFTVVKGVAGYTLQDDDKYIYNLWTPMPVPAALSLDTPYYAVHTSNTSFYLAATPGGMPIAMTDSRTAPAGTCFLPGHAPSTGNMQNQAWGSYMYLYAGAMNLGLANGYMVDPATVTDLHSRLFGFGGYVDAANRNPMWAWSADPY